MISLSLTSSKVDLFLVQSKEFCFALYQEKHKLNWFIVHRFVFLLLTASATEFFVYCTLKTYYKNTVNQINHASLKFTFSMMLTCAHLKYFVDLSNQSFELLWSSLNCMTSMTCSKAPNTNVFLYFEISVEIYGNLRSGV